MGIGHNFLMEDTPEGLEDMFAAIYNGGTIDIACDFLRQKAKIKVPVPLVSVHCKR